MVEAEKLPLNMAKLRFGVEGCDCDLEYAASQLWGLLGDHMTDHLYDRRIQMASGEDQNGIELWRRFFRDHEGGAEQVKTAGISNLHSFPRCKSVEYITNWLGEWNFQRILHGEGLADDHLRVMLINLLPVSVAAEIRRRTELVTLTQTMD